MYKNFNSMNYLSVLFTPFQVEYVRYFFREKPKQTVMYNIKQLRISDFVTTSPPLGQKDKYDKTVKLHLVDQLNA